MSAIRLFCMCILMLALPLQGYAAASMLYCVGKAAPAAAAAVVEHGMSVSATRAVQEHTGHEHTGHDHAAHAHAAPADDAAATVAQADTTSHKCAVCAYCAHAVVLNQFYSPLEFGNLPHTEPAAPLVLIQARAVVLPEKPPRV